MSVTTTKQISHPDLEHELPGGYTWTGGRLEDPVEKSITGTDSTDPQVQAAIDAAAAVFVDLKGNLKTITENAKTAHQNNRDYLNLPSPTNAQVAAQVAALTRQNNGLIRVLINDLTGTV